MQVTFDSHALKPFTRALTCLSRYGEELTIYATPETLSMSCTNSSKSAYCRFRYSRQFFSKYRLGNNRVNNEGVETVTGQLMAKALLSILRHHSGDSSLERCEISIVDAEETEEAEDEDSLESRLVVRLHCKHGVVKTHKLLMLTPTSLMAPPPPDSTNESFLKIGPRAMREIIEHFPLAKGAKADPQLIWNFGETDVRVKSLESSIDSKGKAQLLTELTIPSDEFDVYHLDAYPIALAFHLREFNATIAFTEQSSLTLDLRFTDPAAPLFIDVEGDCFEVLFVISTSQVQASLSQQQGPGPQMVKKRIREDTPGNDSGRFKKPMKAVHQTDRASMSRSEGEVSFRMSMPPPSILPVRVSQRPSSANDNKSCQLDDQDIAAEEPLFLPAPSQLTISGDENALRESGLGIENMTVDEFNAMLEDDQDVEAGTMARSISRLATDEQESLELVEDEPGLAPTQNRSGISDDQTRTFHPLFDD
ncbi:cell cycle checkpoint control protein rad9a [Moniliophthora roreri MCA 2997]|uniref:Cell cycle checkpoint control protein rad9a n=1 Tax=Moniliophthora roreri (strain MCA 2997) TaxID=1381753 RepID=V2XVW7_MONRO|nr:cell cycle checkpoint control protein rad9a [Moniliophthora roreri MCA 2997]